MAYTPSLESGIYSIAKNNQTYNSVEQMWYILHHFFCGYIYSISKMWYILHCKNIVYTPFGKSGRYRLTKKLFILHEKNVMYTSFQTKL